MYCTCCLIKFLVFIHLTFKSVANLCVSSVLVFIKRAITKLGIRESGNQGIGESGNMETVGDIGMLFVVSSTTTIYKSIPKKSRESPMGSSQNTQSKVQFLTNY